MSKLIPKESGEDIELGEGFTFHDGGGRVVDDS